MLNFYFNNANYLWINNEFVEWKTANVHLMTHSLHYASSVFEGIRTYNGKAFKLEEHIDRLFDSAQQLMIPVKYSKSDIIIACKALIEKNNLTNAYIRPLIWKGAESSRLISPLLSTNVMLAGWEIPKRTQQPMNLCFSNWINIPPQTIPIQCKSGGRYTTMIISKTESENQGFDDAILLDWRGYISEATTSNIFFVAHDKIITPIADACLNGITRQTVFAIAKKLGIIAEEQYIKPEFLIDYQACFLVGTSIEIREVNVINFTALKNHNLQVEKIYDLDNSVTSVIKNYYNKLVNDEEDV
ncbi:branched-chain amino acid aminotransferase [Orientia tsutsugamushi str. Ikeda]|uniref:Probable branched-chain-amino-acid aminotransferase n=1 Tax=Orientia tsutsugamushi (strain Ikeda) TaxID=334380 RepID=B3CQP1_ORITI|nr:aminotransferase class IV [Orientia tsutsugamushi]BAG39540.1 branched-chain amino acid aminotransferase [Orientia tsutsugamushi str. Ikeda]